MTNGFGDTIIALATPPGTGAIGVIRLSGPQAIPVADQVFKGKRLADQASHTLHFGWIIDPERPGELIDEVVMSLYRNPRSYTGEDIVEISCHGSPFIQQRVMDVCIAAGAVPAQPGEFTKRAFLNGKLDLTQAEAVADLIASQSSSAQKAAMHNLRGGFSAELREMRERLINFTALIELELDFSEEDVEFADRTQLYALIEELRASTSRLIGSFRLGNVVKNGVNVAIAGKPNAGKSTLLNTLLREERAIVSDIAGTTRDTIEEVINIDGILFRFIDTAGIRSHTSDTIEEIGIRKTFEKIDSAAILIYLADIRDEAAPAVIETVKGLTAGKDLKPVVVFNKADLISGSAEYIHWQEQREQYNGEMPVLLLSVKEEGRGLDTVDDLKRILYQLVADRQVNTEDTIITNTRHYAALQQVLQSLEDIKAGMDNGLTGDLLALDIRRCLHFIGEITGEVQTDRDILGTIFGKFCIGK